MTVALDASAVLALLNDEPGQDRVMALLDTAVIGAVNLAEVIGGLVSKGKTEGQARAAMRALGCPVIDVDEDYAIDAGVLRSITATAGLSLGDRFCLAVGRRLAIPVLTADRNWDRIAAAAGVDVRQIR